MPEELEIQLARRRIKAFCSSNAVAFAATLSVFVGNANRILAILISDFKKLAYERHEKNARLERFEIGAKNSYLRVIFSCGMFTS
ncbi:MULTISPECIES: hypothetical protein [Bartonella]|uniref:hypothetical protein n=1 Tax=Bartonella TaxID=773 RepID=UPI0018DCF7A9|nr:hypothetical protein [Bartonella choladocola]MBI0140917.1 hypothetical protein [Bartonella choladocola]